MHLLLFLLSGLVIGAAARSITPGSGPGGWITREEGERWNRI